MLKIELNGKEFFMSVFIRCFFLSLCFCQVAFSEITPKQALQKLLDGNERYTKDLLSHSDSSLQRREAIACTQKPFAVILGCSDSRVPPEIIFDQGLGDLFVVRVAGNVVGPLELDSIEYSTKYLKSSLIVVLGHESCGAIKAVLAGQTAEIDQIARLIEPALKECRKGTAPVLDQCVKSNVNHVVKQIKEDSRISKYIIEGQVDVVGGYYDLNTGRVEILR